MVPLKFLVPFVLASLVGHALVLALTTGFSWRGAPAAMPAPEQVMTVSLEKSGEREASPVAKDRSRPAESGDLGLIRDETVSLQAEPTPYDAYLLIVRRKIEERWLYPPQALAAQREGDTVVRFAIEADGRLSRLQVIGPSGIPSLDAGALAVVRAAAPYGPLPAEFRLSRLNITATFSYRMKAD